MAKTDSVLKKKYPDLTDFFAQKEKARSERASRSPKEKFELVQKQREIQRILRSAKVIKKGGLNQD
ncbi:MAG: hypothetical protein DMF63_10950 [Acidobacteria bacterium]|nr:MAG: hypothetical protein DMF63_10950 [Acidobacteriota bacterium]